MQENRVQETPEETTIRRASMRQHAQKRRPEETTEEIEIRRVSSRRYRQERRNVERNQHVTTEASAAIFASKIAEGPIYACCSCYRLLYKTSVVQMNREKYLSTKPIERILNSCTVAKHMENLGYAVLAITH